MRNRPATIALILLLAATLFAGLDARAAQTGAEQAARQLYERAERMRERGELAAAIEEMRVLVRQFPRSPQAPDALLEITMMSRAAGDLASAQTSAQQILDQFGGSHAAAGAEVLLADIRLQSTFGATELEEIRTALERIPIIYPPETHPDPRWRALALVAGGEASLRLRDPEYAGALFITAVDSGVGGDIGLRARLGAAHAMLRLGQWQAAATFLSGGGDSAGDPGADSGPARRLASLIHRHYILRASGQPRWSSAEARSSAGRAFDRPTGVAAASDGRVMIGDENGSFVVTLNGDDTIADMRSPLNSRARPWFGSDGARYVLTESRVVPVDNPEFLAFTYRDGNEMKPVDKLRAGVRGPLGEWYLAHDDGRDLSVFGSARTFQRVMYSPPGGKVLDLAVTPDGDLLALEERSNTVLRFREMSAAPTVAARGSWDRPQAVAVDDLGVIYVLDRGTGTIHVFSSDGTPTDRLGPNLPGGVRLDDPRDLAVDGTGRLLIADRGLRSLVILQ